LGIHESRCIEDSGLGLNLGLPDFFSQRNFFFTFSKMEEKERERK
jgi:hypothetical protein